MRFTLELDMTTECVTATDVALALRKAADSVALAGHLENSQFPDNWSHRDYAVILCGQQVGKWAFKSDPWPCGYCGCARTDDGQHCPCCGGC